MTSGTSWLKGAMQYLGGSGEPPQPPPPRADYIRAAVDCLVWGERLIEYDAMREAFRRDAGAQPGDIVYLSRAPEWHFQMAVASVASRYVFFPFNTRGGPVVIDLPPARGARIAGGIVDAWGIPLMYIGAGGGDAGKGGRYLVCGPGDGAPPPEGYTVVPSATHNGYVLMRLLPLSESEIDVAQAITLAKQVHWYPLSLARKPPRRHYIDIHGMVFDAIPVMDASAFNRLARMIDEEPFDAERDGVTESLRTLRLGKGRPFQPSADECELLEQAANEARSSFVSRWSVVSPWWPGRQWGVQPGVVFDSSFRFRTAEQLDASTRGVVQYLAYGTTQGQGALFSVTTCRDSSGQLFRGEANYWLRVPPNIPARRFWSVSVYDLQTRAFIRNSLRQGVHKHNPDLEKNRDGSIDVFFGPARPGHGAANWIDTGQAAHWFAMFRFHGPDNAVFEKTWRLPDIEQLSSLSTPAEEG